MTRTARKGTKKEPLPATPWSRLKEPPHVEDEDSAGESVEMERPLQKVKRGRLKPTKKTKLKKTRDVLKGVIEKVKQKKAGRRVRFALTDTMPLLEDQDDQESDQQEDVSTERDSNENTFTPKQTEYATKLQKKGKEPLRKRKASHKKEEENEWLLGLDSDENDDTSGSNTDGGETTMARKVGRKTKAGKTREGEGGRKRRRQAVEQEEEEVDEKRQKNIEARRLRRQKAKVCFNCRKAGHLVNKCPQAPQVNVCYRCGAGDHISKNCKSSAATGEYAYATCFVCGETGHLSSWCPDNPRGIYPEGGGCKVCGSVEHKKANCPKNLMQKRKFGKTRDSVRILTNQGSADAEVFGEDSPVKRVKQTVKSKHKIIKLL